LAPSKKTSQFIFSYFLSSLHLSLSHQQSPFDDLTFFVIRIVAVLCARLPPKESTTQQEEEKANQ
jgi:hypothetical protein